MPQPTLLAVPNVSDGSDAQTIGAIADVALASVQSTAPSARLLDTHSDPDHDRSVFTLAAGPKGLTDALLALARETVARIDLTRADRRGQHPHVGALDVAPVVYLTPESRGAACAEALVLADRLATELAIPVFLYGDLTADADRPARTRADLRRGGLPALTARMAGTLDAPPLRPDFGPQAPHPTAGVTLVSAREPLVAFNLQLALPATIEDAHRIASSIREGGSQGLPGLRAIAIHLSGDVPQVSMNVERPLETPLAEIVSLVRSHAPLASAELVGLAPAAAFEGFPEDLPMPGFDPARHLIENALQN
jgi:glutamate formiminotransferase/glutamate formiminotransferase/formiminotetrahydrofolate cyclodeaminase